MQELVQQLVAARTILETKTGGQRSPQSSNISEAIGQAAAMPWLESEAQAEGVAMDLVSMAPLHRASAQVLAGLKEFLEEKTSAIDVLQREYQEIKRTHALQMSALESSNRELRSLFMLLLQHNLSTMARGESQGGSPPATSLPTEPTPPGAPAPAPLRPLPQPIATLMAMLGQPPPPARQPPSPPPGPSDGPPTLPQPEEQQPPSTPLAQPLGGHSSAFTAGRPASQGPPALQQATPLPGPEAAPPSPQAQQLETPPLPQQQQVHQPLMPPPPPRVQQQPAGHAAVDDALRRALGERRQAQHGEGQAPIRPLPRWPLLRPIVPGRFPGTGLGLPTRPVPWWPRGPEASSPCASLRPTATHVDVPGGGEHDGEGVESRRLGISAATPDEAAQIAAAAAVIAAVAAAPGASDDEAEGSGLRSVGSDRGMTVPTPAA